MSSNFAGLPLIGHLITDVSWRKGLFFRMTTSGVSTLENGRHAIRDHVLQFNRCADFHLDVHWDQGLVAHAFAIDTAISSDNDSLSSKFEDFEVSSTRLFRITMNRGYVLITASGYSCSLIREDIFSDDDEKAFQKRVG